MIKCCINDIFRSYYTIYMYYPLVNLFDKIKTINMIDVYGKLKKKFIIINSIIIN